MKQLIQISPFLLVTKYNRKSLLPKNSGLPHESEIDRDTPANFKYLEVVSPPESGIDFDSATSYFTKDFSADGLNYQIIEYTTEELEAREPEEQGVSPQTIISRLVEIGKYDEFHAILTNPTITPAYILETFRTADLIMQSNPYFIAYGAAYKNALSLSDVEWDLIFTP